MRTAILARPSTFEIRKVPVPNPGERQIRVRIEGCGVCASNVPVFEGRPWFNYPMEAGALGHEAYGRIDSLGRRTSRKWKIGQRIAFLGQHSYAEYDVVDEEAIAPLPEALDGKPVPAEPIACAVNIFKRSCIKRGDTVAIVGMGFLGALLTQFAVSAGARVITLSRRQSALDLGRKYGASCASLECPEEALEAIKQATSGKLCNVVIEATGKQAPLKLASEMAMERGRLVIAGYHQDGERQINMQLWNWRGLDVINAHERDPRIYVKGMREGIRMLAEGRLSLEGLITHLLPLEQLNEALRLTRDRPEGFMKAIVEMSAASRLK